MSSVSCMKLTIFWFLAVTFCLAGFIEANAQNKVLVVYYSRTGHTKIVAERLAKKFNAEIEPLIDQHKRTGLFGISSAGSDAIGSKLTKLEPLKHNLKDYDIVLIGGPSWFGNVTPAVRTFINQNDLAGKKVGLFGLCHLTGVENALKEAAALISKDKKFALMPLRERELKDDLLAKRIEDFYKAVIE